MPCGREEHPACRTSRTTGTVGSGARARWRGSVALPGVRQLANMECVLLRQCFFLQRSNHTRHSHLTGLRHKSIYSFRALHPHPPASQPSSVQLLGKNQQALVEPGSKIQLLQEGSSQDEELEVEGGGGQDSVEAESLKLLEWLPVCQQVSRFASTHMARDICRKGCIPFGRNQKESEKLLEQTASALLIPSSLDFSGVVDVSTILRSVMAGDVLNVSELCMVGKLLSSSKRVYDQLHNCTPAASPAEVCKSQPKTGPVSSSRSTSSALAPLLSIMENANFCTSLVQSLNMSLDSSSLAILDTASPNLLAIRASRKENMKTLERLLLEIGGKVVAAGGMDSVFVTTRRARQCVAVRASHKHLLPGGVVLDMSNTGATVFMEPKAALELNNNEVQLASKERAEESLILEWLTQELADVAGDIWSLLEKMTHLDLACAKAGHGRWLSSVKPIFSLARDFGGKQDKGVSEGSNAFWVYIEGLSHPLLLEQTLLRREEQEDASFPVPLDFKVKSSVRVIVISGPNTGGKTASMKTFGMATLMAKAGLFVPAKGMAVLPWFDQALADIGDSQSLEQSLSTFSGHIRRVCRIMEAASYKSLVLFDEIGSGTDPSEGAALASAILEHMADHACLTIVTTHFSKLSSLTDQRFEGNQMHWT
ncbi:hypothetical protein GOP47_0014966 [Adiantum capillus-veneris]|uniref:DNA mismatch repair proteins mutS family domain-containing protein n=1 Tax=Adiantum capillus-veneris TaxID=13818 RepID=A0A9D4UNQ2_ADICA|nr:hypothetical protein GOP47_0014966 [Adiantum capillus-veneris]